MWLILAFLSATSLGIYDVFRKAALKENAVIPVLFLNTLFCSLIFLPVVIANQVGQGLSSDSLFYMPSMSWQEHLFILLKSFIVLTSWLFTYFATKHLPLTITSPIKAAQPILNLLGALVIFSERLNLLQSMGVILGLFSFLLLSRSGKKEGIDFRTNKWILFMALGVTFGAISGLYDKFLMGFLNRMNVQVWYNYYQVAIMGSVLFTLWWPKRKETTPFRWNWAILGVSFFLSLADFIYFYALSDPQSMISIVSLVRRSGVVVAFIFGALWFKEKNLRSKALDLVLVIISMLLLYLGTR